MQHVYWLLCIMYCPNISRRRYARMPLTVDDEMFQTKGEFD